MYYRNQELLKTRYEQFSSMNLLATLDQVYQELRLNLEGDRNTFIAGGNDQPDCFQQQEIFSFPQQATVLFEAYGPPTSIAYYCQQKRNIFIGTQLSVIICINIVNGRTEKIEAIFNSGENQGRYGPVTSITFYNRFMLCGFARGDVQLFEVNRKWERLQHVSRCHKYRVNAINVLTSSKPDSIEALSFDEGGILLKHTFSIMSIMDKLLVKSSKDKLYENGKCKRQQQPQAVQIQVKSSWWGNAKQLFSSSNDNSSKDTRSEISRDSFRSPSVRFSEEERDLGGRLALDFKIMPDEMAQSLQQDIKKYCIAAIQYIDRVEILRIQMGSLRCEIIYTLKRNNLGLDAESSMVRESGELSWGEGYFQHSYQNAILLSVRWSDVFHLVKCLNIEEDLEIVEGAVLRVETEKGSVLRSSFLTNNIICIAMDDDSICLVHTTQFQFAKQNDDFMIHEAKTRMLSREELQIQVPEIKIQYEGEPYPYQNISEISNGGIVLLRRGRLLIQRLQSWDEYIKDLSEKQQFERALQQAMLIYQGQIKILGKVASSMITRNKEMRETLEKLAFTHIMFLVKPIDITMKFHQEEMENKIKQTFEFLIKTDHPEYIFALWQDFFKPLEEQKLFFTCFEPFVESKQIANIPESFFQDYVNFYTPLGKREMVSKVLILQLDLRQQEPTALIKVCLDLQLYKAMIYLCTRQGDFITALMKLVDLWERKLVEEGKETNHIEREKVRTQRIKLGLSIQAYVRMCLKGINILGERVPQAMFADMLRGLLKYLFNADNLRQYLLIDVRISLQVLVPLFSSKLLGMISQQDSKIGLKESVLNIVEKTVELPNTIATIVNLIEEVKTMMTLEDSFPCCSGKPLSKEEMKAHFDFFYSRIMPQIVFVQEFKVQLMNNLLSKQFMSIIKDYNYQIEGEMQIYDNTYEMNQNAYLIHLFDVASLYEKVTSFLGTAEPYPEFKAFLLFCQRQYEECFKQYIRMSNPLMRRNVFEVIQKLLNKKISNMAEVQKMVIRLAGNLIQINEQISYEIFKNHFSDNELQMEIIRVLGENPEKQLFYLKSYLKTNISASDDIRLLYLELLCQKDPSSVLSELQQKGFPLDDALKICEKYKNYNAMAYLLQKNGAIQKALELLSTLFFGRLKESHKSFAKTKTITEIDSKEIEEKLQYIIDLIASSQKQDDSYESLWYQFLDNFFKDFKLPQLTDAKVPEPIRKLHCNIVSKVFLNMSQQVVLDELLDKLQAHYGSIPVRVFWDTNDSFRSKFAFESQTYKLSIAEADKTVRQCLVQLAKQRKRGLTVSKSCSICGDLMGKSNLALAFQCGHNYHQECFMEQYGQDDSSFNSHKLKNLKVARNCFLCLDDRAQYVDQLLFQIRMKRQGTDIAKWQEAQQPVLKSDVMANKQKQAPDRVALTRQRISQLRRYDNLKLVQQG